MTDIVDSAKRSIMMAGIRTAHTRPELVIQKALHQRGFRYRLQARGLPGSPDIVLRRYNAVVFVHGGFWQAKFMANIERDKRNVAALSSLGWRVGMIWEYATAAKSIEATVTSLGNWLITDAETLELPPTKAD